MSHEELWTRIFQIGTAGLGWPPQAVMDADMSDVLLAWEGRRWLNTPPEQKPGGALASPEAFRAMFAR